MIKISIKGIIIFCLLVVTSIGVFGLTNSPLKFYSIHRGSPPVFTPKLPAIYPSEAKSCREDNECIVFTCQCGISLRKDFKGPPSPPLGACQVVCETEAKCVNRQCKAVNIFECKSDSDCVVLSGQCSYSERSINKNYAADWNANHPSEKYCPTVICTEPKAVCENSRCKIRRRN